MGFRDEAKNAANFRCMAEIELAVHLAGVSSFQSKGTSATSGTFAIPSDPPV